MKIRIFSDLHRQINKNYKFKLEDKDTFTLIAGDVGPDYKKNAKWLSENIRNGAFISGNHDAYNTTKNFTIEDVKEYYHKRFPIESNLTYFDYDVGVLKKEISKGILLVADILYTNYEFECFDSDKNISKKELREYNISRASPKMSGSYMNDFRYFTRNKLGNIPYGYQNNKDNVRYISPQMYLEHFNLAFKEIDKIVSENKDKQIIIMTHHCLSPKCIGDRMDKGSLNASYVSNKESWIKKHDNIKLIVSGHVHNQMEFHIGKTLYVMNPLGYCRDYHDRDWTPNFFVDTQTWKVEKLPYTNEAWKLRHKKDDDLFLAYTSMFI